MGMRDEVATREQGQVERRQSVAAFIQKMGPELQRAMPKHLNGDRMVRIATTVIRQSTMAVEKGEASISLADCVPESFAGCLLTASALGLEPGINGQAWLIPRADNKRRGPDGRALIECTFQIGYQGMIELALRHPMIKDIRSGVILESDPEDLPEIGSLDYITRLGRARLRIPRAERGEAIGYWGLATTVRGGEFLEVLSAEEVQLLRGGKIGPQGKIKDPMAWMERKTALKQALKQAPRSIEVGWAQKIDEEVGSRLWVEQVPQKIDEEIQQHAIEQGEHEADIYDGDGPNFPQDES